MIKKLNENNFDEISNSKVAFVDFSAVWCGPCQMIAPILDEVSEEMKDKIDFFSVDVDESSKIAIEYGITSIPTLYIFKNGKIVDEKIGYQPKEVILNFINESIKK